MTERWVAGSQVVSFGKLDYLVVSQGSALTVDQAQAVCSLLNALELTPVIGSWLADRDAEDEPATAPYEVHLEHTIHYTIEVDAVNEIAAEKAAVKLIENHPNPEVFEDEGGDDGFSATEAIPMSPSDK